MFNPCFCWNLKDGCVTIGIWSVVYSLGQLGMFSWQTFTMNQCRSMLIASVNQQCQEYCPCAASYQDKMQTLIEGLFVVQIVNLIASFFLLFAAVAVIYGVHSSSKHLVWPWFPCVITCMLCSLAYCALWWIGGVQSYWLILTIIEIATVVVNAYCLLCVGVHYRRIVKGIADVRDPYYYSGHEHPPKSTAVYFDNKGHGAVTKTVEGGEYNAAYEQDPKYPPPVTIHQDLTTAEELPQKYYPMDMQSQPMDYYPAPVDRLGYPTQLQYTYQGEQIQEVPEPGFHNWLEGVENPEDPRQLAPMNATYEQQAVQPSSPTTLEPGAPVQHAKSVPSATEDDSNSKHRRHHHHHHRHHRHHRHHHDRSSSVGSESRRSRKSSSRTTSSSPENESEQETKSCHSNRSREKLSTDSTTEYSRSERFQRNKDERSDKESRSDRSDREKSKKHRRPRDIKREAKERSEREVPEPQIASTSASESWPPKYSPDQPYAGAGGITIPQHIVIPPSAQQANGKPKRYQINSEITISYSDRSANPSDTDAAKRSGPRIRSITDEKRSGPSVSSPSDEDHKKASIGGSSRHGSTAV